MNDEVCRLQNERKRLRLLYSLGDFKLALSAAEFLAECDPTAKYSMVDIRRFRCYETAMIVAYIRPFSQSKGEIPPLSLKMAGAQLTKEQNELHERVIGLRNRVIAHSDAEMMRMVAKAHEMTFDEGFKFVFVESVFDEGLTFVGLELLALNELIRFVFHAVVSKLYKEAQKNPEDFNIRKDHLRHGRSTSS